ncbi:alpha/beta fold hydrolase [Polaribacter litorisediminis]|uniref:alpha/beta hydrolase family protein n=1 Tax=Polaribacter litorisediminis TaxID=1908341 RepID=UPI001CBB337E|nr:alpha/beta fold hydrolase [Polaribacter litorisediminis]UAM97176.1 alpha/beta fold hydrolase [Polaribacter litorisediminis]
MMTKNIYQIILLVLVISFSGCKKEKVYENPISENITFKNIKDNITLSGTLSIPSKDGIFPAVVLISGNGEHNRNEEFGNFKPFLDISNYLTKQGIAVLRYDKRGVGESTGNYDSANSFDFANDVTSAIEYLLTREGIKKNKIGLIGHSEGGLIAPIVASQSSNVAFIVSLAGPSLSGDKILLSQQKAIALATGTDKSEVNKNQKLNRDAFEIVNLYKDGDTLRKKMTEYIEKMSLNDPDKPENMTYDEYVNAQVNSILRPWMVNFLRYNPKKYIEQVQVPVLALNGTKDLQVLASENLPEWKRILESSGNKNVTIKELQNLNHLFQTCETGQPDEYEKLNESFSVIAMSEISKWIKKQTK